MSDINVLVVDDFLQNLVANEAILARPGLNILKAGSGNEALELLLAHEVALALIDVQMPGMDGFELAEMMRGAQRTAAIPIIFMTAAVEETARNFRGYQAGAVDFLNKPIHPDILRGKVEVFVELHEQKNRIRKQRDELRQALQMNELFIAVLGHDLRTPLSAVMHGAELVLRLGEQETRIAEAAKRIRSSAARMNTMVRQLLDVAQTRGGRLTLYPEPANYLDVAQRVVEEIEHRASASRICLTASGDLNGVFDADRMSQVISNLIGNALQHGSGEGAIQLRLDGTHVHSIVIQVENQGAIPPDVLEGIFLPFRSTSRERVPTAGLGLGLYIVREFVARHDGSVSVSSTPERGITSFEITVPRTCRPAT